MQTNKRSLIAASCLAASMAFGTSAHAADKNANVHPDKVVYHVNDSSDARAALRNITNHMDVNPEARIVVVTHALGVDFLMKDARDKAGNPYHVTVEQLELRGVTFDICEITLANRKLEKSQFIPEAKYVPSGVAELAKLQARGGYAYIKP
jgi:intracellular sulfur oxidation DsrE/DsrF family protein